MKNLEIADGGKVVWLREFGFVKIFRTYLKNQIRDYAVHLSPNDDTNDENYLFNNFVKIDFEKLHDQHWKIEQYHRTIKQVCHIESFQVRNKVAVKNHIFSAIFGYLKLQQMQATEIIKNCYRLQRDLFNPVIMAFIKSFTPSMNHMNSQYLGAVNV